MTSRVSCPKKYVVNACQLALLQGRDGNAAAEVAGGPPCLSLAVHLPAAGGEPRLEVHSKTQGWEAKLAGAETGATLQASRRAGS